jgi:hypothetical protein
LALSLKDLQAVMAPLTELGKGEATFEVNGLTITIRTLTPEEEISIQRHARGALTEGDANDQINALDYLDRFRSGCLGHAIVQIGDMDFRGMSTVETGETLPSGVTVKVKKHEAIMQVVETWSRPMVVAVFNRFTSLMERIESNVEKSLKYDDDHIEAEIARLEEKLSELKATKGKQDAGINDPRKDTIELAGDRPAKPKADTPTEPVPTPVTWETARVNRTSDESPLSVDVAEGVPKTLDGDVSTVPVAAQPMVEKTQATATEPAQARMSVFGDRPAPRDVAKADDNDPLRDVTSSLVDTSDPAVIDAENRRLMAERAKRIPPHQSAREVAQAIEQTGTRDGMPVFKMPTETLNRETAQPVGRTPPPVTRSNTNPNFRPAKT